MLGRPLITTITPHQFCESQTAQTQTCTSQHEPSSASSSSSACSFVRVSSMLVLSLLCMMVPSIRAQDCVLTIPDQPLTIAGLARPWILSGPGCSQTNANTRTFVQGAVIDQSGTISIYDPLVVDQGKTPFANPVSPQITQSQNPRIAYWVQTHARTITLADNTSGAALRAANCSSGLTTAGGGLSRFGKFAFCNAFDFFRAANIQAQSGILSPPTGQVGSQDGLPCPSFRDFHFMTRDHHGTVMTTYLVNARTGQTAHDTPTNNAACNGACIRIQSDSARLINNVYETIGCALWAVRDLTDSTNTQLATALPLNELQARADMTKRNVPVNQIAYIPANDTLATIAGTPNVRKLNLLRSALNQPEVSVDEASVSTYDYCVSMTSIPPPRLASDARLMKAFQRQGDINEATNLYTLVVKRQIEYHDALGCQSVAPVPFRVVPRDWTVSAATPLEDAEIMQPDTPKTLRCQNMFIIDTKCSFLVALLVVGGGLVTGFILFIALKIVQSWKYGDKMQQDSTKSAIRV